MRYRNHLLFCTALVGCASAPAFAQSQQAQAGLEEIIVSARKADERIVDVPMSVTAITAEQIATRGMVDINDIAIVTPGLTVQNLSVGRNDRAFRVYIIRGMIPGNGLATRASVSTFVDGALVFGGNITNLAEIDHVETVKGPQAAFFGRGSFAGAINFVTRPPSMDTWGAKVSADVGSHKFLNLSVNTEGPVIKDKLAIRVGGTLYNQGPQYANPGWAGYGLGERNTKSISASFVATPSDNLTIRGFVTDFHDDDGLSATAQYLGPNFINAPNSYNCNPGAGAGGALNYICGELPAPPVNTRSQAVVLPPTYFAQLQKNLGANFPDSFPLWGGDFCTHVGLCRHGREIHLGAEYNTSSGYIFSLNGSLDLNRWAYIGAGTSNPFGPAYPNPFFGTATGTALIAQGLPALLPQNASASLGNNGDKDENAELRVMSPQLGRFKVMAGFNYFHDYSDNQTPGYGNSGPTLGSAHSSFVNYTYGLFGSVNVEIGGGFSLVGEVRHQWEEIWQTTRASTPIGSPYPVFDNHSRAFTPRAIAQYKPDSDMTYYISYSEGTRPIEFNTNYFALTASQQAEIDRQVPVAGLVVADRVKMGEVGAKGVFLNNTLRLLADVYYGKWTSRHVPNTVTFTLANGLPSSIQVSTAGGIVDLWGIELEATYAATPELTFDGTFNLAATNIRYTFCNDCLSVSGNPRPVGTQLPYYPKYTATLSATYKRPVFSDFDGFVSAEWAYRGRIYESEGNFAWTAPTNKLNVQIGLEKSNYRIALYGRNITDNKTPISLARGAYTNLNPDGTNQAPTGRNSISVALPDKAAYGIRASVKF